MLERVKLENFKCFSCQEIPLKQISVLTGLNGMGKSTVLQSLLLLKQSSENGRITKGLKLNGEYASLGSGRDVLYRNALSDEIRLTVWENKNVRSYTFAYEADSGILPLNYSSDDEFPIPSSALFSTNFLYLSSARIEPKMSYGLTADPSQLENHEFGANGEFSLQYLAVHGDDKVRCTKAIRETDSDTQKDSLKEQLQIWYDEISPGVAPHVKLDVYHRMVDLDYDYREGDNRSDFYKSVNVGFGITYVLPVLISLLASKPGDLILMENPEAHIHPRGQRMLGELIARVAASGVQIIIETHSDHILNGIRISVKNGIVDSNDVQLAYFEQKQYDDYAHTVVFPKMYPSGQISEWPEGFFDEWQNALLDLL